MAPDPLRKLPPGLFENALLVAHFTTLPHATDQTNLEVQGEVDNETVDDEGCSEEMPAGKSEKAAKEKEEQLEAEQTPMVKKGMHRVIGHSNYAWKQPIMATSNATQASPKNFLEGMGV